MDYVVAGFGIGAILALIGFALWELFAKSEEPEQAWLNRTAIGLMLGALVIWAVTGVSLISTIDDSTGSHLVLLTTLVTLVAIAGGTYWYWRADQAMMAARPQAPRAAKPQAQSQQVTAASAAPANVELSEWDQWPEREERSPASAPAGDLPAPVVSFEPEVAAEPENDTSPTNAEDDGDSTSPTDIVMEDMVLGIVVEGPREPEVDAASEEGEAESRESEGDIVQDRETGSEAAGPMADVAEPPPPFRPVAVESATEAGGPEIPAGIDVADTAGPTSELAATDAEDADRSNQKAAEPSVGPESPPARTPPAVFESSLLADIDVTTAEGDGRYRSPLLADLDSDPDELEGIGLAKWRPEDRLTAEDQDEPPRLRSRRRR